jgi:hypothetical protein
MRIYKEREMNCELTDRELLLEVTMSGIVLYDERIDYVTVQIDSWLWEALRKRTQEKDEERLSKEYGMSEEIKISDQLKNLANAIIENISNISDKEITEEVREEHNDPEFEANIMRDIIKEVKAKRNDDPTTEGD